MKIVKISFLIIFSAVLCTKGSQIYGADDKKNGCGPSKSYELKEDKSEPITYSSASSSSNSSASNSSTKSD